jgi:predicted membrane-bound dolichyl-phosphate-mannose-protein mannosyltransferase
MFTLKKKNFGRILTLFLLLVIFLKLGFYLQVHRGDFIPFDELAHQRAYLGSNYSQKSGASIPDHIVLGYAAWEYVHGENPTLINPEMPPLGKYLMGCSLLLFGQIALGSLIFGLGSLILVFLIGKKILKSNWLTLIPLVLLLFEPLFINQLTVALLETYHLFFILLSFYFFLLAQKKKLFLSLAVLALGGVIATKFYVTGGFILFSWGAYLLLRKDWSTIIKLTLFFATGDFGFSPFLL